MWIRQWLKVKGIEAGIPRKKKVGHTKQRGTGRAPKWATELGSRKNGVACTALLELGRGEVLAGSGET
ncbi:MAG: hypothetical protein ACKO6N_27410 [Myxococcota bacterium]